VQDTSALDRSPFDVSSIPDDHEATPLPPSHRKRSRDDAFASLRRYTQAPNRTAAEPAPEHGEEVAQPTEARSPDASENSRSIESILAERQTTHGDFTDNARVMQSLKRVVQTEVGWDRLTDVQREALHMILHKVGRIISGNPNTHDHWDDIAGYAKLASERIAP